MVSLYPCAPRVHALELEKSLWLFCSISGSSPGLRWDMSGVLFRDQLESFTAAAAKSLQLCPTLCDPIDGSHQAPLSLEFSRQEHLQLGHFFFSCLNSYPTFST